MALYEVTVGTTFLNQLCVNRFNYESTGTPAAVTGAFGLASAFGGILDAGDPPPGTLIAQWKVMVSNLCTISDILVRNVYDPTDFYQTPILTSGQSAGETMPPFAAFGFRSSRTRLDIRRGFKRFVGVPEGAQNGGVFGGSVLAVMDTMATRIGATLTYTDEGNSLSFAPVIVQKEKILLNPGAPIPNWTYRYYETLAEQSTHLMRSTVWEKYLSVRSQVSRQFNRGQ